MNVVAKVLKPHGIRGEIKIKPYTDDLERFKRYNFFYISSKKYLVAGFKSLGNRFLILKLKEFSHIDEVKELVGMDLLLPREVMGALLGDLIEDYIGFQVFSIKGEKIGSIKGYLEGGENGLYEISFEDEVKNDFYLPCSKEYFEKVDFADKSLVVKDIVYFKGNISVK